MTLRLYFSSVTECAGRGRPGTAAARGAVSDAGVRSREQSRVQHPPPAVSDPIRIHTKDLVVDLKNKMLI